MAQQQHPEILLLSALVRTAEHQTLAAQGITSSMFHVAREEMTWVEGYIRRHGKAPSKAALRQQFPSFVVYKVDETAHWCEQVIATHKRQSAVDLLGEVTDILGDEGREDEALERLRRGVSDIKLTAGGVEKDFDLYDDWQYVYDEVCERVRRVAATGSAGIPTGFESLDDVTGGYQPGWYCIIAARLGNGKTWTAIRSAWAAAMAGNRVAYFSLEQSKFQIATRIHAFGSRQYALEAIDPRSMSTGVDLDLLAYKKFLEDMKRNKGNSEFIINDTSRGRVTPSTIAAFVESKQPDIVFIDYLTLMARAKDDWQGTADLSSELQSIAQRYRIPVVALSQVNRAGGGKVPPTADTLSQADAIGQDADMVVTNARQSLRVMKHRLAKCRHAPDNITWYTKFSPQTGEYDEITPAEAERLMDEDDEED